MKLFLVSPAKTVLLCKNRIVKNLIGICCPDAKMDFCGQRAKFFKIAIKPIMGVSTLAVPCIGNK